MVVFFTSITTNYLPKARVLAESVKRHHPDGHFMLLLSDALPDWLDLENEPFDSVVTADQLGIPDFPRWAYMHSVVELCTAVKGPAFRWLLNERGAEKAFYLDPDMAVFSPLTPLIDRLDQSSVLLTPHQLEPETTPDAVLDNEICSLKHGVFNLGFLGLRNSEGGRKFADWWAKRLLDHCYDDIPGGLFTDQRWVDLAPCFFDDLEIVRDPEYNVATWNLTHRHVEGSLAGGITVNGRPLRLYHFSGFDSGAQEQMLNKYGRGNTTLWEMRDWYIAECEKHGQEALGRLPAIYGVYDNGEKVSQHQRLLYRSRTDLMAAFPNPYVTDVPKHSYLHWYRTEFAANQADGIQEPAELLRYELQQHRNSLERIHRSRAWRLSQKIASLARLLRLA
ncbi:glycosyl transferase [Chitinimonas arctica]|uniref:Glycosyl transferase n=1 Tax=Chitinimonas arctica TaxID=2594795 RepID=A0A516SGG8_9NEIS|nr:glycosyl transferase [Chitinimonas arctica]QDQ27259.1 glycosyl transferase [Chitinimonas arctica]